MTIEIPILIKAFELIDPIQDHRWVPDGENQWFFPHYLDLKNNTYSGYWYLAQQCIEEEHLHTGISNGVMLLGKILLKCGHQKIMIEESQTFFVPPHTLHSAELIPSKKGFLNFGSVVGETYCGHEKLDANSYYATVETHYLKYGISLNGLINK